MADPTVVPLFVSEADVDAAWSRFDGAMTRLHELYRLEEASEPLRRAAAFEALAAEADFRAAFSRMAPTRRVAGA